ncbi:MAG: hypothetical protein HeimC3_30480 [Candidatus Heimdallarchaeota archaeon LC_3]|nr:MAG: hypothetical protein HeimC3_30480 [Candidatus Heimdallarchaeota archaeon LC_3]
METISFEKIETKTLSTYFANEREFSQWLKDNPTYLEEILKVELSSTILTGFKLPGGLEVDILTSIKNHKNLKLFIENQFGGSDHKHLGQILTYMTETGAKTAIWIAENIRREHQQTLTQLNNNFKQEKFFFGIEVQIILIGKSKPSINFIPVVIPEEWDNWVFTHQLTTTQGIYNHFWKQIIENFSRSLTHWQPRNPSINNWMWIYRIRDIRFQWAFGGKDPQKGFSVQLSIRNPEKERNTYIYNELYKNKTEIEEKIGRLIWDPQQDRKRCLIQFSFTMNFKLNDIMNDPLRSDLIKWGVEKMKKMIEVFEPKVEEIT